MLVLRTSLCVGRSYPQAPSFTPSGQLRGGKSFPGSSHVYMRKPQGYRPKGGGPATGPLLTCPHMAKTPYLYRYTVWSSQCLDNHRRPQGPTARATCRRRAARSAANLLLKHFGTHSVIKKIAEIFGRVSSYQKDSNMLSKMNTLPKGVYSPQVFTAPKGETPALVE
jgi:hypothetical protein